MIFKCTRPKSSRPALRATPLIATCTLIPLSSDPISKRVKLQIIGYLIGLLWASAHKITDRDIRRSPVTISGGLYLPAQREKCQACFLCFSGDLEERLQTEQLWRMRPASRQISMRSITVNNREASSKHLNLFWLSFWHNCFRISLLREVCIKIHHSNYLIIHKTHTAQYKLILWASYLISMKDVK